MKTLRCCLLHCAAALGSAREAGLSTDQIKEKSNWR
jgi:hypothetical protein